jgi:hypothetical protein
MAGAAGDEQRAAALAAALIAAATMSVAAVAAPLDLPPVVPFLASAVALGALLAAALGTPGWLARLGQAARRASPALLAAAAIAAVWDRHVFVSSSALAPDDVLAAATLVAAVVPRVRRVPLLVAGLAVATYVVVAAILIVGKPYHSDAVVAAHGAAQLLLAGHHPYADFDMVDQLRRFGLGEVFATPLDDGARLRMFQYPALVFLAPLPLVAAGLADLRVLYLAEVLAVFALVAWSTAAAWRAVAVAMCLGSLAVLDQFVLAGVDPLWALLVLGAWLARRHRASALLLGLAVSTRQPAWLVAPFLVAWTWRARGRWEALLRAGLALGLALLIHLPFLVTAPAAVLAGVTAPALLPLEPWGVGPAKLAADAGLPVPRPVYLTIAGASYLAALWAFATGRARGGGSALVLPLVALWVAWRALLSYFAFLGAFGVVERGDH